jgi:hypothetical protein
MSAGGPAYAYCEMSKLWRDGEAQMQQLRLHRRAHYMPSVWGTQRMFDL